VHVLVIIENIDNMHGEKLKIGKLPGYSSSRKVTSLPGSCVMLFFFSKSFIPKLLFMTTALGRLRHKWEDNIKTDLQEVGWGPWIGLI